VLYVTTRNNTDPCTPQHVLQKGRGDDGGFFLPFSLSKFSANELQSMAEKSFNQRAADILNLFFSKKLTAWDLDFCIGRYPVRVHPLRNRIAIGETWHNPEWNYDWLVRKLLQLFSAESEDTGCWTRIAIQTAVFFGIFGGLDIANSGPVDISVVAGDFTAPLAAWYAREMGLPIGNIVCCCNENKNLWDLICLGQMRTDGVSLSTVVPEADVVLPLNLERFLWAAAGREVAASYLKCCSVGRIFSPEPDVLAKLQKGLFVSVVSSSRVKTTIPNVYKTHNYLMTPGSALAYSGLLDYRAKTGNNRPAIVISCENPSWHAEVVSEAMGISVQELKMIL